MMHRKRIRSVGIIGSGMAGLACAIRLNAVGIRVGIYEKSRGPGGRMASKRFDGDARTLDMGAQYFTVRNTRFRRFLESYAGFDTFAAWSGRLLHEASDGGLEAFTVQQRFVGTPRMSAITRALSRHVPVEYGVQAERLEHDADGWRIISRDGHCIGPYDALVLTPPPAQSNCLLNGFPEQQKELEGYSMLPCMAVAVRFSAPLDLDFEGVQLVRHPVLRWAGLDSSKPGRDGGEWWVLHAEPHWSRSQLDKPEEVMSDALVEAFRERFSVKTPDAERRIHRWRYAIPETEVGPGHLWYPKVNLGLCGDWLSGGRVEGAFDSAESLLAHLRSDDRLGFSLP